MRHGIYWNDKLTLPYKPHIGTLSCSPEIDSINSLTPDNHGGNMDVPDLASRGHCVSAVRLTGARVFLLVMRMPARATANFAGTGVEIASYTTIHVDLIKGGISIGLGWKMKSSSWPLAALDPWRTRHESLIANSSIGWKKNTAIPRTTHTCCSAKSGIVRYGEMSSIPKYRWARESRSRF